MKDEERIERRDTSDVVAGSAQRNLTTVLLNDVNTVTTTVVSAVGGAYAIKKILGGKPDGGKGDDPGPPEAP
jgi:hypothetical protein